VSRNNAGGNGRLGFIVSLALIGSAVFVGFKYIPVRVAAYEFRDFVERECRHAAVSPDDGQTAKRILEKAKDLQLPLQKKDLKVTRTAREMIITASIEKPIDFKLTTYRYPIRIDERAPLF
jgi:hypothetical protein